MEKIVKTQAIETLMATDVKQIILEEYFKRKDWRVNDKWKAVLKDITGNIVNGRVSVLNGNEISIVLDTKQFNGKFEITYGNEIIGELNVKNGVIVT